MSQNKHPVIPSGILFPFILLTSLFAAWGLANNMTDTLLAAFKRIMSMSDSKTAWIQVTCYLLGYGCFAIPGAMFMKRYTYKSGVLLGLGLFIIGGLLFYPAMFVNELFGSHACFLVYLAAILILFAGLSILETACNPFICTLGPEQTATRRLNFAQSFNPLGSIMGVILAQVFILSQLKTASAEQRAAMTVDDLNTIQRQELFAITNTYGLVALVLIAIWLAIFITRMPALSEIDKRIDLVSTWKRLLKNYHYVWGVVAQFFYVGAQIACWSFIIRYSMVALEISPHEVFKSIPTQQLAVIPYTPINGENPSPPLIDSLRWSIPHNYKSTGKEVDSAVPPNWVAIRSAEELAQLPAWRTADIIDVLRFSVEQDRLTELVEPAEIAFAANMFSMVPIDKIALIPTGKQIKIIEALRNKVNVSSEVALPLSRLVYLLDVLKRLVSQERFLSITAGLEPLPNVEQSRLAIAEGEVMIPLAQLIEIVDGIRNEVSAEEISQLPELQRIELFDAVRRALPDEVLKKIPTKRFEALFTERLRNADPLMRRFCYIVECCGLTAMLPRTSEQAGATYYILSLIGFVISRFICTWLMRFIKPHVLLTLLAFLAVTFCVGTIYLPGAFGVYSLIAISACMSLMFPTIFGLGTRGLGGDMKMGGAGMVMTLSGAALLTQIQGYASDLYGIRMAYWVPTLAFILIAYYAAVVCRNDDRFDT